MWNEYTYRSVKLLLYKSHVRVTKDLGTDLQPGVVQRDLKPTWRSCGEFPYRRKIISWHIISVAGFMPPTPLHYHHSLHSLVEEADNIQWDLDLCRWMWHGEMWRGEQELLDRSHKNSGSLKHTSVGLVFSALICHAILWRWAGEWGAKDYPLCCTSWRWAQEINK